MPAAAGGVAEFQVQDMEHSDGESLGAYESWKPVHRGRLVPHDGPMGAYLVGDLTAVRAPGIYRVVLPPAVFGPGADIAAWSFPFPVADGVYARLPGMFLDYMHGQRCGDFENDLRGPCHLDDGVRTDTGAPIDAVGGWHDAGDVRKWMGTATLPILGLFAVHDRPGLARGTWREKPFEDDFLAEAAWGVRWILKMQDPGSGMFYEDVGGGGDSRKLPGMTWWYENHAGCYADNSENRFTDNIRGSGDERRVRVQYHPIVQYLAASILLEAAGRFAAFDAPLSALCRAAALRAWAFMETRCRDEYHDWTSVRSWRLLAALRLRAAGIDVDAEIASLATGLIGLQSREHGFWHMDTARHEPYRGIVNAAQPVIAMASFIESCPKHPLAAGAADALRLCRDAHVAPMVATNPFGMMPYGVYAAPRTKDDVYHPWRDGLVFRFYMPEHAPERVNHGLSAHWTSWAHGLAAMARVLEDETCRDMAFDQLGWLTGNNPLSVSMITGVGSLNASPYSRAYGTMLGGFCIGPRGTAEDGIYVDMQGRTVWSSGEYWSAPLANALLALSELLPAHIPTAGKLG